MLNVDDLTQATLEQNRVSADYAKIVTLLRRLLPSKQSQSDDDKITTIMHDTFWCCVKDDLKDQKQRKAYKQRYTQQYPGYFDVIVQPAKHRAIPRKIDRSKLTRADVEKMSETTYLLNKSLVICTFDELELADKVAVICSEYPEIEHSKVAAFLEIEVQLIRDVLAQYGLSDTNGDEADNCDRI